MEKFKNLFKSNNIIKYSLILVLFIVVVLSTTLAYYSWGTTNAQQTNVAFDVISDGVYIYYNGGPDIIGKDLFPTDNKARDGIVKEITVRVDEYKEDAKFNLYLDLKTLPNALKHASFKYELYQASTLKTSGNFTNAGVTCTTNTTKHIVLLSNQTPSTTTVTYTLYIWIDGVNFTNPDTMMNQEFEFTLHADGVKVKNPPTFPEMIGVTPVLDTDAGVDFSKTSESNGTNGLYILSSTQNDAHPIYYYRGGGTDTTTGEELVKNNLIFADTCWKIIRTTSTGGLRLIYNGTPNSGKCDKTNFTDNGRSASTSNISMSSTSSYYYGTDYTFNTSTGSYTLSGTKSNGTWSSDKVNLYTCRSTSSTGTCTTLYYIDTYVSTTKATAYSYTSTSNSQITTNTFNSSNKSPAYVGYMYGTVYTYGSDTGTGWYYAPDVSYSNGTYTLTANDDYNVETKSTISGTNLNYQHYTCGSSTETTCTQVRYVYNVSSSTAYYITLSNGKKVEDALSEMLDYNTTSSTIKGNGASAASGTLDYWYKNNIDNNSTYKNLVDYNEIFCNDRSIYQLNGWNPDGGSTLAYLYFGAYGRLVSAKTPTLTCSRDIDKFTVVTASVGNKTLTYPVGLITADEIVMAGSKYNTSNSKYYLYTGQNWWAGSPYNFYNNLANEFYVNSYGSLIYRYVTGAYGVRPVVSLASGYTISDGDGSTGSPFIVE